jgi:riboflavin synthase
MNKPNTPHETPAQEQELHAALQADRAGTHARELVSVLGRSQQIVRTRLRGQRAPAEFKAAEQLVQALDASERVIRQVWESMHGRRLQ